MRTGKVPTKTYQLLRNLKTGNIKIDVLCGRLFFYSLKTVILCVTCYYKHNYYEAVAHEFS